jgi:2-iminobutanoate/2-iminopropanoate deaminase
MNKRVMPTTIAPPASNYSHGIEVPPDARWLYVSGQVGVGPDGVMAEGIEAQADQAWKNLIAVLEEAGMSAADLVRVNAYITNSEHVGALRQVRLRYLDGHEPASTLAVVAALASPEWLFEIEAVAARAG